MNAALETLHDNYKVRCGSVPRKGPHWSYCCCDQRSLGSQPFPDTSFRQNFFHCGVHELLRDWSELWSGCGNVTTFPLDWRWNRNGRSWVVEMTGIARFTKSREWVIIRWRRSSGGRAQKRVKDAKYEMSSQRPTALKSPWTRTWV